MEIANSEIPAKARRPQRQLKPITVTVPVARDVSGLGNTLLYEKIADGTLELVTVGRRRLVIYESLERLLAGK